MSLQWCTIKVNDCVKKIMLTHSLHSLVIHSASDFCWFCRNSMLLTKLCSLDPNETVEPLPHGTGSARCTSVYESPLSFLQPGKYKLCSNHSFLGLSLLKTLVHGLPGVGGPDWPHSCSCISDLCALVCFCWFLSCWREHFICPFILNKSFTFLTFKEKSPLE